MVKDTDFFKTSGAGWATPQRTPRAAAFKTGYRDWAVAWAHIDTGRYRIVHLDWEGNNVTPSPGYVETESISNLAGHTHELDAMQCNSFVHSYRLPSASAIRTWYPQVW